MRARTLQIRMLVTVILFFLIAGDSACAQEKPKRMIPGPSVKELVPESPNEKEDGISKIIIGQLFKPGNTEYTRVGAIGLKDAPPLPTGFVLFKDLVFQIRTEAITSGYQLVVFNLPTADNETEFNRLSILHLEDDEMSPAGKSWQPVTVVSEGWDDHYHFVTKSQYESLESDFKSRRLAAVTHRFGVFLIGLAPQVWPPSTGGFTNIEVTTSSSPEPAVIGERVYHSILVKNTGLKTAAEVNVKEELNTGFDYESVTASQGTCHRSDDSTGRVLCYLGVLPAGAHANITITARVRNNPLRESGSKARNDLEINFKENSTDFVEADNQIFQNFNTTIIKKTKQ